MNKEKKDLYRVMNIAGQTDPTKAGGSLAAHIKEVLLVDPLARDFAEMSCIGASSVNQGVKAVAICNGMLGQLGIQVVAKPAFKDTNVRGEMRSSIRLLIKRE